MTAPAPTPPPDGREQPVDVDELERLAKAATPNLYRGDATADSLYHGDYAIIAPGSGHGGQKAVWCQFNPHFVFGNDAELFVNARAAILALVKRVRDAEAERDALRQMVKSAAWSFETFGWLDFGTYQKMRDYIAALAPPAAGTGDGGGADAGERT
jgi:hypothetical protein